MLEDLCICFWFRPQVETDICHCYCNLNSNSEPNIREKNCSLKICYLWKESKQANKKTCLMWFGKYSILCISEGTDEIIQFFKAYPKYCKHFLTYNFISYSKKRCNMTFEAKMWLGTQALVGQWLKVSFMGSKFLGCLVVPPLTKV